MRQKVRIEMLSNYDCMGSHWLNRQCGYSYSGSYFKDMIDALQLSPARVKEMLGASICSGTFPKLPNRSGKEYVDITAFINEIINSCGGCLLTFCCEIFENVDISAITKLTIPAGTNCGLFDSWGGGGSLMEMTLNRDMAVVISNLEENNYNRTFRIVPDIKTRSSYSVQDVYGVTDEFYTLITQHR